MSVKLTQTRGLFINTAYNDTASLNSLCIYCKNITQKKMKGHNGCNYYRLLFLYVETMIKRAVVRQQAFMVEEFVFASRGLWAVDAEKVNSTTRGLSVLFRRSFKRMTFNDMLAASSYLSENSFIRLRKVCGKPL